MNKRTLFWCLTTFGFAIYGYFYLNLIKMQNAHVDLLNIAPLFILGFLLLSLTILLVKHLKNIDLLVIIGINLIMGVYSLVRWYGPRTDFVLAHQQWLNYMHYLSNMHTLIACLIIAYMIHKKLQKKKNQI